MSQKINIPAYTSTVTEGCYACGVWCKDDFLRSSLVLTSRWFLTRLSTCRCKKLFKRSLVVPLVVRWTQTRPLPLVPPSKVVCWPVMSPTSSCWMSLLSPSASRHWAEFSPVSLIETPPFQQRRARYVQEVGLLYFLLPISFFTGEGNRGLTAYNYWHNCLNVGKIRQHNIGSSETDNWAGILSDLLFTDLLDSCWWPDVGGDRSLPGRKGDGQRQQNARAISVGRYSPSSSWCATDRGDLWHWCQWYCQRPCEGPWNWQRAAE